MHFDDRLATVLRHRAASARGAVTQYRQLLDLLGASDGGQDEDLRVKASLRLGALAERVPDKIRAAIITEAGPRLRNPKLVARLAEDEPAVASAALGHAKLLEDDWLRLIPTLPIRARGLLRHRRDLPASVAEMLALLGVGDNVLPMPDGYAAKPVTAKQPAPTPAPKPAPAPAPEPAANKQLESASIGALVDRIEQYRKARSTAGEPVREGAPRLPLGESEPVSSIINLFDFSADTRGRIDWASGPVRSALTGFALAQNDEIRLAIRRKQTLPGVRLSLAAVPLLTGDWQIDAAPQFSPDSGRVTGYVGRARRIIATAADTPTESDSQADRIRQMLHELRTPVNAIQGFAEVIQQQLFGAVPHEYRALAATIAGDAARMLAGFEELDRLAKLEAGALELEDGESDLAEMLIATSRQLSGMLRPRMSEFVLENVEVPCLVAMSKQVGDAMIWRLMATLAGAVAAGEVIGIRLERQGALVQVDIDLPAHFLSHDDIFSATMRENNSALSAGMFGAGFALRLAKAEAREAGGDLVAFEEYLQLTLPLVEKSADLTDERSNHSAG